MVGLGGPLIGRSRNEARRRTKRKKKKKKKKQQKRNNKKGRKKKKKVLVAVPIFVDLHTYLGTEIQSQGEP